MYDVVKPCQESVILEFLASIQTKECRNKIMKSFKLFIGFILISIPSFAAEGGIPINREDFNKIAMLASGCNFTLITSTIGITAAHCVEAAGSSGGQVIVTSPAGGADYVGIDKIVINPEYQVRGQIAFNFPVHILGPYFYRKWSHDLALVKLNREARVLSGGYYYDHPVYKSMDLSGPKIELSSNATEKNDKPFLVSVGSDGALPLKKIFLNVNRLASRDSRIVSPISKNDHLCPGDSGGSVFQENSAGKLVLVGTISSGLTNKPIYLIPTFNHSPRCPDDLSRRAHMIDIALHRDWIDQVMNEFNKH